MNRQELKDFRDEKAALVTVNCDEYHSHSALRGCIEGPKDAVMVCKMWEYVSLLEAKLEEISKVAKLDQ